MTVYARWSIDALRGYLVMADALMSGTTSEDLLYSYRTKVNDIHDEIHIRTSAAPASRSLAFPAETIMSGSTNG